jgi:hypothetical protein
LIDISSGTIIIIIVPCDGSCLGSPVRSGFDDIIRNIYGDYLAGFSGFIQGSSDILLVDCMLSTRPLIGQGHEY